MTELIREFIDKVAEALTDLYCAILEKAIDRLEVGLDEVLEKQYPNIMDVIRLHLLDCLYTLEDKFYGVEGEDEK